ncbi:MAG: zinc-dependent metalloprotease [Planctomycetaceae bacterium]
MLLSRLCRWSAAGLTAWALLSGPLHAQGPGASPPPASPPQRSPFEAATSGAKKVDGLIPIYYKDQQILAEVPAGLLNQNLIVITSIAKGISAGQVLGGMSWGFGDDAVWAFNKSGEKMQIVRRNPRFKAAPGSPESAAVKMAYSDSILYALPIVTTTPSGGSLVDMSRIFLSDDQQIGRSIGMGFSPDRSTVGEVKGYPTNTEIEINAVYSGSGELDTVPDARGAQVAVHYSISRLPQNDFRPRVADDRVGYFLTVVKDFSDKKADENFQRFINRWHLKKKDPAAKLSPVEEPIVFYIEKTTPINLRPYIRAGIEEWNKAFAKLGYDSAVQVRDQRDNDDIDPEDVRYNFFRWITANAGFAMGPSRVNPFTGQILDADIIFDADFLSTWKQQYETFTSADMAALMGQPVDPGLKAFGDVLKSPHNHRHGERCDYCQQAGGQIGFAASVMLLRGDIDAPVGGVPDELIAQGLKEVVMHEVGHTLGLRHNFKASSWKTLAEIDNPALAVGEATVASVMDYTPTNIAPKGQKQGLYYTGTLGPYDYWAIEYGYKPIMGNEPEELKKIASRCGEPGLDYLTDEDTRGSVDSDPLSNRFDLGKDPLEFARRETKTSSELWAQVVDRAVVDGDGYQRARQAFGMLFGKYWQTLSYVARFPGGVYVHRDHKGDPNGRKPFVPVEAAKQREAMKLLTDSAFNVPALPPADVLNSLASSRWSHWGTRDVARLDYPVQQQIANAQSNILNQLLATNTLTRLSDFELKSAVEADVYTLAEHLRMLVDGIFTEIREAPKPGEYTNRKPYINALRRNLQRTALKRLAGNLTGGGGGLAALLGGAAAPEDVRTLVRMHLVDIDKQITTLLAAQDVKLDDYTRAHLQDSQERIRKVLTAQVMVPSID